MLTITELGTIEQILDVLGLLPGDYRDGVRDCLKIILAYSKSQEFTDLAVTEFHRALAEALMPKN